MGKNQISQLKLLGYLNTQEDGAILEHPSLGYGCDSYVWKEDTFSEILLKYSGRLEKSLRNRIANSITK